MNKMKDESLIVFLFQICYLYLWLSSNKFGKSLVIIILTIYFMVCWKIVCNSTVRIIMMTLNCEEQGVSKWVGTFRLIFFISRPFRVSVFFPVGLFSCRPIHTHTHQRMKMENWWPFKSLPHLTSSSSLSNFNSLSAKLPPKYPHIKPKFIKNHTHINQLQIFPYSQLIIFKFSTTCCCWYQLILESFHRKKL